MNEISRKMGNVADFPLRMNLQLFAGEDDGTPNLEDSADYADDAREFNSKMDKYAADRATKAETENKNEPAQVVEAAKPEVAEPETKQRQDSETNKAFQEMRRAKEEAEKRASEIEERSKKADALIAQQYGHMGITTVEQYEAALQREQEAENAKRYEESGLTAEEIEAIRNYKQLKQQVETHQTESVRAQTQNNWDKLYQAYPDLVDSSQAFNRGETPEWYTPEMRDEIARGASPLAAYRNAHFETIMQKTMGNAKEQAKQEAIDKLNSKEHLAPNASTGGEVDHVEIDEETMRAYRALNKGKSDAQIRAWHKKHAN